MNVTEASIKSGEFISFYHNKFRRDAEFFCPLAGYRENSPYHREASIAIHTDMVISHYLTSIAGSSIGAFACAFHDVGKPSACEVLYKEQYGGEYYSFKGHEIISARMWEDYAMREHNYKFLREVFSFTPADIYIIGYLIEHHLPYQLKDKSKRDNLRTTLVKASALDIFFDILRADAHGRISDDHQVKTGIIDSWIQDFHQSTKEVATGTGSSKICHMLIGPSGCGKSTFAASHSWCNHYSWDRLRLNWYVGGNSSRYKEAFASSIKDEQFYTKAQKQFHELLVVGSSIVIDNTNLSRKRRAFFINSARQKGYKLIAHLFPISFVDLYGRALARSDKSIDISIVERQYYSLQLPSYGEFDEIQFHPFT